jgi:uncharacterized membrane protein YdjX (TVP38/TMEM64 family)
MIAISGILPSAFLTAANITILGFKAGLLVSIAGEALGAIVAFILYRKGMKKLTNEVNIKNKLLLKLQNTNGWESILIVIMLRILPFVPSGIVTLTAAFSKMGLLSFAIASTIGKIPSLIIEAYSINSFLKLHTQWQIGLTVFILIIFGGYYMYRKGR